MATTSQPLLPDHIRISTLVILNSSEIESSLILEVVQEIAYRNLIYLIVTHSFLFLGPIRNGVFGRLAYIAFTCITCIPFRGSIYQAAVATTPVGAIRCKIVRKNT